MNAEIWARSTSQSGQQAPTIEFAQFLRENNREGVTLQEYEAYRKREHKELTKQDIRCLMATRVNNPILTFTYIKDGHGKVKRVYQIPK